MRPLRNGSAIEIYFSYNRNTILGILLPVDLGDDSNRKRRSDSLLKVS